MPTGSSRGSNSVRARVSAQIRKTAPASAESGSSARCAGADEQPDGVRQDQADEADRAADRDERAGEQRRAVEQRPAGAADVDAERGRRGVAERERVERGALASSGTPTTTTATPAIATEAQSAPASEPSSQLRISR